MYLLAFFILQNFKKEPIQSYEDVPVLGSKWPICPEQNFLWYKPLILSSTYWPFSLCKILKNSSSRSRVMRMHNFCTQNGPFPQMRIFFRKPVSEPCFFHSSLPTCQKSKSGINLLVKY